MSGQPSTYESLAAASASPAAPPSFDRIKRATLDALQEAEEIVSSDLTLADYITLMSDLQVEIANRIAGAASRIESNRE